jgi:asparagine synthetase B (glutamine-hydrolysing)
VEQAAAAASTQSAGNAAWIVRCPKDDRPLPASGLSQVSSGRVHVAVAGTLFEPEDLATRLSLPPAAANNPAQLVLEAYRQLGDDWLRAISGHYAIVIEDQGRERLLAARDGMGQYPLFYAEAGGALLFSWSTEALLSSPGVSRALNRVMLAEHILHRWSDPQDTYFAAIQRVPPGYVLEMDHGRRTMRRHWDPARDGRATEWLREDEVERFDAVLERAVSRCLARGRTAIFLSGGFDSISIGAVAVDAARRAGQPPVRALSLGFPDPACNEEFVQRGAAQSLGISQDFVPFEDAVGKRGLLIPATEMAASWPVPMFNLWNPAYYELGRRGREHGCSVILTGSGGDEWLTVSPYLSADLIKRGDLRGLARLIRIQQRSFRITPAEALKASLWTFGARPLGGMVIDRIAPAYWRGRRRRKMVAATLPWVAPDPALRSAIDDRAGAGLRSPQPGPGGFYEQEGRTALDHPLMAIEAEEHFEFGRRLGAAILHPYWDQDLVELLWRTPPWLLLKGGRAKGLVRDTVARRFPNLGFQRQRKVHATNFYWTTLQKEGPAAWAKVGNASALADLGVVDASRLADTLQDLFAGRRPRESYKIWNVLQLEAWARLRA